MSRGGNPDDMDHLYGRKNIRQIFHSLRIINKNILNDIKRMMQHKKI